MPRGNKTTRGIFRNSVMLGACYALGCSDCRVAKVFGMATQEWHRGMTGEASMGNYHPAHALVLFLLQEDANTIPP